MSRKLRVFVSSTMKDLANEREAVCGRLHSFNFEPVNAEGWLPTGTKSWDRIEQEIESSDVFVLILGERYGWIPERGPKSELGLSVTHLEYQTARELGIPILPFLKKLDYDADRTSNDAQKRDAFRKEVGEWAAGEFFAAYELASDLAENAGGALVALLTSDFLRQKIQSRAPAADRSRQLLEERGGAAPSAARKVEIPAPLAAAVAKREAILFAGAGISMAAGLPSAAVFAQSLSQSLLKSDPDYAVSPVGSAFSAIAADVEASTSREFLVQEVRRIMQTPRNLQPTAAHVRAVALFDLIVTTNWDGLFEEAATAHGRNLPRIAGELVDALPQSAVIKFHGSPSEPSTLLVTETEVMTMDQSRPRLWKEVSAALRTRPVVVVGSSLRDPSIVRLFADARREAPGYFVGPNIFASTTARLRSWKLECIEADADTFFEGLSEALGS